MASMKKKNRPYFSVFFPEKTVASGQRYMFFNSLPNLKNAAAGPAQLYDTAHTIITNGLNDISTIKNNNGLTIIEQSMKFLQQMILQARKDETQWISTKIVNNKNIPRNMREQIKVFVNLDPNNNEFDYLQLTQYLNLCVQGLERYEYILKYEHTRLQELEELFEEVRNIIYDTKHSKKVSNMMNRAKVNKNLSSIDPADFEWQMAKQYLFDKEKRATQTSYYKTSRRDKTGAHTHAENDTRNVKSSGKYRKLITKHYLGSQTLLSAITKELEKVFNIVWNNPTFHDTVRKALSMNKSEAVKKETIGYIVTAMGTNAAPEINKIIQSHLKEITMKTTTEQKQNIQHNMYNELVHYITTGIEQFNSSGGSAQEQISYINLESILSRAKKIQQETIESDFIKSNLFKGIEIQGIDKTEPKRKRSSLKHLSNEAVNMLLPILENMEQRQTLKRKYTFSKRKPRDNEKNPRGARAKAVEIAKLILREEERLRAAQQGQPIKLGNIKITHTQIAQFFNKLIGKNNITISLSGRTNAVLSEINGSEQLKQVIANSIQPQKIGKQFAQTAQHVIAKTAAWEKSDLELIDEGFSVEIKLELKERLQQLAHEIYNSVIIDYDQRFNDTENDNNKKIDTALAKFVESQIRNSTTNGTKPYETNEFSIRSSTERRIEQWKNNANYLRRQQLVSAEEAQLAKAALEKIQQDTRISTTVKDYNKYNNNYGFKGGSLGGSLEHQVDNIIYMFELGGITTIDRDWLLFSIYNSGKNLVGHKERESLEYFLSILAVSLLFSDIGEQWSFITGKLKNYADVQGKYLHLYLLNGMYIPSSMILQLTYDSLCKIYSDILGNEYGKFSSNNLHSIEQKMVNNRGSQIKIINNVTQSVIPHLPVKSKDDWSQTFQTGSQKVSLQLFFLAGFLDILEALDNLSIK